MGQSPFFANLTVPNNTLSFHSAEHTRSRSVQSRGRGGYSLGAFGVDNRPSKIMQAYVEAAQIR